jgi:hypothetical protein
VLLVLMLALLASLAALPTTAEAAFVDPECPAGIPYDTSCPGGVAPVPLAYTGWAYMDLNYCGGCWKRPAFQHATSAWSWTGTRWTTTSIRHGWVYLYPYTGSWRWAWTQSSGWVAIEGGRFSLTAAPGPR